MKNREEDGESYSEDVGGDWWKFGSRDRKSSAVGGASGSHATKRQSGGLIGFSGDDPAG